MSDPRITDRELSQINAVSIRSCNRERIVWVFHLFLSLSGSCDKTVWDRPSNGFVSHSHLLTSLTHLLDYRTVAAVNG